MIEVGERVLALSHTDQNKAYIFGYGTFEGEKVAKEFPEEQQPSGLIGQWLVRDGRENPCIKLDDGKYVWGCECWWGPAEVIEKKIEGLTVEKVDIQDTRKEWYKEIN